ncbi:Protein CYP-33C9 [Aphelenchoides avenae]|nr:Protein CYP-33C9 [Aphelenchus avenae]
MAVLLAVALLVLAFVFYNNYWKRRNLPPGPTPWPIVGNSLAITKGNEWEKLYLKWRDQYGDVYTYWMGVLPVVAINNYEKIIETFQKDGDAYAGRMTKIEALNKVIRGGTLGVINTSGDVWRDQRRFALTVLRDFGLGKDLMQQRVLDEVSTLISEVNADIAAKRDEHDVPRHIDLAVGSIINSLLFGYRFRGERVEEFTVLKEYLKRLFESFTDPWVMVGVQNPQFWRNLPLFKPHWDKLLANNKRLFDFYGRQIEEHQKEIDFESGSQPTDYVEAFLREKKKNDADGFPHYYSIDQLKNMCFDLWLAGQETTSTTLAWGVSYMINWPEAQKKTHEELDRVVGSDRIITLADRPNLPYTCAVVNEIQRLCNLVPQNVFHETTRDVTVDGYHIPKGTCIIPQIAAVLYDPKVFPEPTRFNPDRFMDEKGNLKRVDELIPFSVGKRQCLGESLARMELFLFVANLFNQFSFSAGATPPTLKRKFLTTVQCPPYTCRVVSRHTINGTQKNE